MITVIVPIYNVEAFLPRCIESILAQTYGDFELILVDDGSPDNCGAICDAYAQIDNRIRVIHQKNCGLSAARNAGLDAAQGEYIAFCDSDDYLAQDYLESLYSGMIASGADIVSADYTKWDPQGNPVWKNTFPQRDLTLDSEQVMLEHLINDIALCRIGCEVWTRLFKKDIIQRYHIRFCETCESFAEDLGFTLVYTLHCRKIATVPSKGYYYLLRENSIIRKSEGIPRLNEMNEVSVYVGGAVNALQDCPFLKANFPMIHFYIMNRQYMVINRLDHYRSIPQEVAKIKNRKWYSRQTKALRKNKTLLAQMQGRKNASFILAMSNYCLHGSWALYRLNIHLISLSNRIRAWKERIFPQ